MAGANVHARDDGGLIPLHNACSFGHAEVSLYSYYPPPPNPVLFSLFPLENFKDELTIQSKRCLNTKL